MTAQDDRDSHWKKSPMTTRHSQAGLLVVSVTWGLSYMMPVRLRVPFSEVFPATLTRWSTVPMWGWGLDIFVSAVVALVGERVIMEARGRTRWAWAMSFIAHAILCATYVTLGVAALVEAMTEAGQMNWVFASIVSALSRTVLWCFIAYQHYTYATLPRPIMAGPKRHRAKRKLRWVESNGG
jgi:hypothetical protein